LSQFSFDICYREGGRHINAHSICRFRPCEIDSGQPYGQCNKRVSGKHGNKNGARVLAVQTRAQRKQNVTNCVLNRPANDRRTNGYLADNHAGPDAPPSQQVAQPSEALEFSSHASAGPLPRDRLVSDAFNDSTHTTEAPHATADQPAADKQHGYTSGVATA